MHQANIPSHSKQQGMNRAIGIHKLAQTRRNGVHIRNSLRKRITRNQELKITKIRGVMHLTSCRRRDSARSYVQSRLTLQLKAACYTSVDTAHNANSSSALAHQGGADTCIRRTAARKGGTQPGCTGPWTDSPVLCLDQGAHFVQDEAPV